MVKKELVATRRGRGTQKGLTKEENDLVKADDGANRGERGKETHDLVGGCS